MDLLDTSENGLGVRTPTALEPGAVLALRPNSHGMPAYSAMVVRQSPEAGQAGGFRLGLRIARCVAA